MKKFDLAITRAGWAAMAVASAACADGPAPVDTAGHSLGSMQLDLVIEGATVNSVDVTIASEDLDPAVTRQFTINVSDVNASVSATERGLLGGTYGVTLAAHLVDDPATPEDESLFSCVGEVNGIVVEPRTTTEIDDLVLVCTQDGGEIQEAGALTFTAEVESQVNNNCPDLGTSRISPLATSVGSSVELAAEVAEGVGDVEVEWDADFGSISDDGTSYTCPEVAGVYDVAATFARESEYENEASCEQAWTEHVQCHSSYEGPVETLPTTFAMQGTCSSRSPCHLEQDGKAWKAVCGNRVDRLNVMTGEADGDNSFPFIDPRSGVCQGSVVDGELVGTCTNEDGDTCEFATNSNPAPDAYCPQLESARNVQVCSGTYDECTVAQDRCNVLLKCGDTYLGRDVNSTGEVRIHDGHDGKTFYCAEPTLDGVASGTCEESTRDSEKATCDYSAELTYVDSACQETMTGEGFILEGCGFDDYCVGVQSGCGWSLVCSNSRYVGVATDQNAFVFTGPSGLACSASVVDGDFTGSCENACTFAPRAATGPGEGCMELPATATASGCTFNDTQFELIQDGCWVGGVSPLAGETFAGEATETSLSFPGDAGYQCEVSVSEEEGVLTGRCLPPVEGLRICDLTLTLGK